MIVCVFILDSSAYELVSGSSDVYELRNETVFKEDICYIDCFERVAMTKLSDGIDALLKEKI